MLEAPLLAHLFRAGLVQQLAHAFGPVEGIVWACRWVWFTESPLSAFLRMRFGEGKMALEPTTLRAESSAAVPGRLQENSGIAPGEHCTRGKTLAPHPGQV
jgi:hypothetical protein